MSFVKNFMHKYGTPVVAGAVEHVVKPVKKLFGIKSAAEKQAEATARVDDSLNRVTGIVEAHSRGMPETASMLRQQAIQNELRSSTMGPIARIGIATAIGAGTLAAPVPWAEGYLKGQFGDPSAASAEPSFLTRTGSFISGLAEAGFGKSNATLSSDLYSSAFMLASTDRYNNTPKAEREKLQTPFALASTLGSDVGHVPTRAAFAEWGVTQRKDAAATPIADAEREAAKKEAKAKDTQQAAALAEQTRQQQLADAIQQSTSTLLGASGTRTPPPAPTR